MSITIRPLREDEVSEADRIFRRAFGTFLGLPDPLAFAGDADWVASRWRADPTAVLAAEVDGRLAGSNVVTRWGSVGFFGPLTVRPDLWDGGVAKRLLEATLARFAAWDVRLAGLFTFAESSKHVALYGKFGFAPRFLTAIMRAAAAPPARPVRWSGYAATPPAERPAVLAACRALTEALYPGLDVSREIGAVERQALGDTVLVRDDDGDVEALAVCHVGAGTEAGSGACYVKFGAVRPSAHAAATFDRLLDACAAFAVARAASFVLAGVNTAREAAYRQMLGRGFRTVIQGVAMHRPNEAGYSQPEVFALDDWR